MNVRVHVLSSGSLFGRDVQLNLRTRFFIDDCGCFVGAGISGLLQWACLLFLLRGDMRHGGRT